MKKGEEGCVLPERVRMERGGCHDALTEQDAQETAAQATSESREWLDAVLGSTVHYVGLALKNVLDSTMVHLALGRTKSVSYVM